MVTRVTWELTNDERRKLARDLMSEVLAEFEQALFALQETETDTTVDTTKSNARQAMLEVIWEIEQHTPDPDRGLELRPQVTDRLRSAAHESRHSLEDVLKESGLND